MVCGILKQFIIEWTSLLHDVQVNIWELHKLIFNSRLRQENNSSLRLKCGVFFVQWSSIMWNVIGWVKNQRAEPKSSTSTAEISVNAHFLHFFFTWIANCWTNLLTEQLNCVSGAKKIKFNPTSIVSFRGFEFYRWCSPAPRGSWQTGDVHHTCDSAARPPPSSASW